VSDALPWVQQPPDAYYNFHHSYENTIAAARPLVLWNILDFSHVNWVHRRNYSYCKVLAETQRTHFLEYGVRGFFFLGLPFSSPVLMWHEFVPPNVVRHLSRSPWGGYTKTEMILDESEVDGQLQTRMTHNYSTRLPAFLLPVKGLFALYLNAWSRVLWDEDAAMILRRQQVLRNGFRDHQANVEPFGAEGFLASS
jgi:hypothetical protein